MPTLRELRQKSGMTQLEVAIALGLTPSTIYSWERGTREPRGRQLQQLARLYGVSADDVVLPERGEDDRQGKEAA